MFKPEVPYRKRNTPFQAAAAKLLPKIALAIGAFLVCEGVAATVEMRADDLAHEAARSLRSPLPLTAFVSADPTDLRASSPNSSNYDELGLLPMSEER